MEETKKTRKKIKKRLVVLYGVLMLIAFTCLVIMFWQRLPYQHAIANRIKYTLESKGIVVHSLVVDNISNSSSTLSNIELGEPTTLTLKAIIANYNLLKVLAGNKTVNIDGKDMVLTAGPYEISADSINLKATNQNSKWQGVVSIPAIIIDGAPSEVPPLKMTVDFTSDSKTLFAKINLRDDKNSIRADAELNYDLTGEGQKILSVKQFEFPFSDGVISVKPVSIPLDMKLPIIATINLKDVELATTLGEVSNGKISGTGKISGNFPIIYNTDGSITLQEGVAQALDVGTISVSPALLPGDTEQLGLARSTLENFHYTKLKILVSSEGDQSKISLALEGKNPDAPESRPVNFNINLSGDILPFIQQSILPLNDFKKLFKQEEK